MAKKILAAEIMVVVILEILDEPFWWWQMSSVEMRFGDRGDFGHEGYTVENWQDTRTFLSMERFDTRETCVQSCMA